MNKKEYIAPILNIEDMEIQEMICGSVTDVDGNAGITLGGDEESQTGGMSRELDIYFDDEN